MTQKIAVVVAALVVIVGSYQLGRRHERILWFGGTSYQLPMILGDTGTYKYRADAIATYVYDPQLQNWFISSCGESRNADRGGAFWKPRADGKCWKSDNPRFVRLGAYQGAKQYP